MDEQTSVFVRIRPLLQGEVEEKSCISIIDDERLSIERGRQRFISQYDYVFRQESKQIDVFKKMLPLIDASLSGYNSTIFAYGQTNSGKTYTICGSAWTSQENTELMSVDDGAAIGLLSRAIAHVFDSDVVKSGQCTVACSFFEIYNERVHDLLQEKDGRKKERLRVQQGPEGDVQVRGLSELTVSTAQDLHIAFQRGSQSRAVRNTADNLRSSRSHAIFQIRLIMKGDSENSEQVPTRVSKLNFVDLAGSEKWSVSEEQEHFNEMSHINTSLVVLARCVSILANSRAKSTHIPYRESLLTRLLQDSIGGNAKTAFIVLISSSIDCVSETISSLRFADTAKQVTVRACVNPMVAPTTLAQQRAFYTKQLAELQLEVQTLKHHLQQARSAFNSMSGDSNDSPIQSVKISRKLHVQTDASTPEMNMIAQNASSLLSPNQTSWKIQEENLQLRRMLEETQRILHSERQSIQLLKKRQDKDEWKSRIDLDEEKRQLQTLLKNVNSSLQKEKRHKKKLEEEKKKVLVEVMAISKYTETKAKKVTSIIVKRLRSQHLETKNRILSQQLRSLQQKLKSEKKAREELTFQLEGAEENFNSVPFSHRTDHSHVSNKSSHINPRERHSRRAQSGESAKILGLSGLCIVRDQSNPISHRSWNSGTNSKTRQVPLASESRRVRSRNTPRILNATKLKQSEFTRQTHSADSANSKPIILRRTEAKQKNDRRSIPLPKYMAQNPLLAPISKKRQNNSRNKAWQVSSKPLEVDTDIYESENFSYLEAEQVSNTSSQTEYSLHSSQNSAQVKSLTSDHSAEIVELQKLAHEFQGQIQSLETELQVHIRNGLYNQSEDQISQQIQQVLDLLHTRLDVVHHRLNDLKYPQNANSPRSLSSISPKATRTLQSQSKVPYDLSLEEDFEDLVKVEQQYAQYPRAKSKYDPFDALDMVISEKRGRHKDSPSPKIAQPDVYDPNGRLDKMEQFVEVEEADVEAILDKRLGENGKFEYLVRWKSEPGVDDLDWVDREDLEYAEDPVPAMLNRFEKEYEIRKEVESHIRRQGL